MSKIEKLIAKIENYKSGNKIEFSDLEKYLKYFGLAMSHYMVDF